MGDITDTLHQKQQYPVSGRYVHRVLGGGDGLFFAEIQPLTVDTVRLDVDGSYPTKTASGTVSSQYLASFGAVDWVAFPLAETSPGVWECDFVHTWPNFSLLSGTVVRIEVKGSVFAAVSPKMTITFSSESGFSLTRTLTFESGYFREAELEVDVVEGAHRVTSIETCAHPNHPSGLKCERLSIDTVYDRAGIDVSRNQNADFVVPLDCAQEDRKWSDQELHDAMRRFWTRYKNRAQWAWWILYAGSHEQNSDSLRGTMFDDGGIYQRQGCAAFTDVWEGLVPAGYPSRAAHLERMRFYSAVHESGHCFNLVHSFEKGVYVPGSPAWLSLSNEPNALSFMNYPEKLGVETFFSGFEYRFSERDLRFMRHAPEGFVMMGEDKYGQNHGYLAERAASQNRTWTLEVAPAQRTTVLDFLEPLTLDVRLTNIGDRPQVIDQHALQDAHQLSIWVRHGDGAVRAVRPYAVYCWVPVWRVLQPGESISASCFVSAGVDRWHVAEPGRYEIFATLGGHDAAAISRPLRLRVAHPRHRDEERLAQEYFTDEVGRALALGGTLTMTAAIQTLEETAERLKEHPAALHAMLTLALPRLARRKLLRLPEGRDVPMSSVGTDGGGLSIVEPQPREARRLLDAALLQDVNLTVRAFGLDAARGHLERYAAWLEEHEESGGAGRVREVLARLSGDATGSDSARTSRV